MKIGIDIDGVLTDIERFIVDYGSKFCMENNIPIDIKPGEYDEKYTFGWDDDQCLEFWNKYLEYYVTKYNVREFAPEVIHKLKEEGNEIYIITARNEWGLPEESNGKMKEFVSKWLQDNRIEYDRIIYTEGSKLQYCVGNYIDVMIEDCPENILDISSKIKVFCYHCIYNSKVKGKNIERVYSWNEIYQKLKK